MNEFEYIDLKTLIPNYDQDKSNWVEYVLVNTYNRIKGFNYNSINDKQNVHSILISSYKSNNNDLLINRRIERNYSTKDHKNMEIVCDELMINSDDKKSIDQLVKSLKNEFSTEFKKE